MKTLILFGETSIYGMECVFIQELPDQVKCLFHASTQMDELSVNKLLTQIQTIIIDEVMEEGLAVVTV